MVKRWLYHRSAVLIISYETFRNHVKLFKKVSKQTSDPSYRLCVAVRCVGWLSIWLRLVHLALLARIQRDS